MARALSGPAYHEFCQDDLRPVRDGDPPNDGEPDRGPLHALREGDGAGEQAGPRLCLEAEPGTAAESSARGEKRSCWSR